MKNWEMESNESLVCYCLSVSKGQIVQAIQQGCNSLAEIKNKTKACTGGDCKSLNPSGQCCSKDIIELIRIYGGHQNKSNPIKCDGKCCCSN